MGKLGKKRLRLEEVAKQLGLSKALLRRHWPKLVEAGLAECEKVGAMVSRTTYAENLDEIWVKLFWVMFELQNDSVYNQPPFLKSEVARKIWELVKPNEVVIRYVAELTEIEEKRLYAWFISDLSPSVSVFMFERLLMRLLDIDLFDMINLHTDIVLYNDPKPQEDKNGY